MLSIKMTDGSRYNTDELISDEKICGWAIVQSEGKTVYLNQAHIVTITEVDAD